MLYIVGLGLGGEHGITVRGLDAVRRCARIYMEARTALLTFGVDGDRLRQRTSGDFSTALRAEIGELRTPLPLPRLNSQLE